MARAGSADVDLAVKAARFALEDGEWSKFSGSQRRDLMLTIASNLEKNIKEISEIESIDNGKPLMFAQMDVMGSVGMFKYYAGWCDKLSSSTYDSLNDGAFGYQVKHPVGVCG